MIMLLIRKYNLLFPIITISNDYFILLIITSAYLWSDYLLRTQQCPNRQCHLWTDDGRTQTHTYTRSQICSPKKKWILERFR